MQKLQFPYFKNTIKVYKCIWIKTQKKYSNEKEDFVKIAICKCLHSSCIKISLKKTMQKLIFPLFKNSIKVYKCMWIETGKKYSYEKDDFVKIAICKYLDSSCILVN